MSPGRGQRVTLGRGSGGDIDQTPGRGGGSQLPGRDSVSQLPGKCGGS